MEKFLLDEKYTDFLLLAEKGSECRAYAFKHDNEIVYVEDIPLNYPRITMLVCDIEGLKTIKRNLIEGFWEILKDHIEDFEKAGTELGVTIPLTTQEWEELTATYQKYQQSDSEDDYEKFMRVCSKLLH